MIVVKKCNRCGKNYDIEFMSSDKCLCNEIKLQEKKNKQKQSIQKSRWDNAPIRTLPTRSNRRKAEAEE